MSDITTTDYNDAGNDMASEPAVVKSVEISASTNDVWRAITEPDKIAQWMGGARVKSKKVHIARVDGEVSYRVRN